jgi:G3E family GTPase
MSELWTDEELEAAVVLDGVVAVVDGRNVARQLAEARPGGAANEAQLQVALADVILLNKVCAYAMMVSAMHAWIWLICLDCTVTCPRAALLAVGVGGIVKLSA